MRAAECALTPSKTGKPQPTDDKRQISACRLATLSEYLSVGPMPRVEGGRRTDESAHQTRPHGVRSATRSPWLQGMITTLTAVELAKVALGIHLPGLRSSGRHGGR